MKWLHDQRDENTYQPLLAWIINILSVGKYYRRLVTPCHEDDLLAHDVLRSYCNKEGPGMMDECNRNIVSRHGNGFRIAPKLGEDRIFWTWVATMQPHCQMIFNIVNVNCPVSVLFMHHKILLSSVRFVSCVKVNKLGSTAYFLLWTPKILLIINRRGDICHF